MEHDIAEGPEQEFEDALKNSQMLVEYEVLDDTTTRESPRVTSLGHHAISMME